MGVDTISCGDWIVCPELGKPGLDWARIRMEKSRYRYLFLKVSKMRVPTP